MVRLRSGSATVTLALCLLAACADGDDSTDGPAARQSLTSTTGSTITSTATSAPSTSATTKTTGRLVEYEVGFGHLGPIEVGMSLAEVEDAAGIEVRRSGDFPGPECAQWFPVSSPNVEFLALDDRLVSVTVGTPFATGAGVGVGADRDAILGAYGADNVQERTNRFQVTEVLVTPPVPESSELRILFSMTPGADEVQFIKTGTLGALNLDEGCA